MALKITGYYKLPNEIEPQLIEFDKVFNISFMRKYTNYKTFAKFLTGGKFNITCQKDFEELPEDLMDKHVSKNTQFKTWQEMLDFATDKYIISKQNKIKSTAYNKLCFSYLFRIGMGKTLF